MSNDKKESNELVAFGSDQLKAMQNVGIKNIDMKNVEPASMFLMQKSSTLTDFVDIDGMMPSVGQFFYNGSLQIFNEFECNVVYIADSTYVDKRKPELGELPERVMIGVVTGMDLLFGMRFRGSAYRSLNTLIIASKAQQRPIFSFKVKMESKELSNDKGVWYIPVVRILGPEEDEDKLNQLAELAFGFDQKAYKIDEEE